jgi:hypothetical protein
LRLSAWRAAAPNREAMSSTVLALVEPVLSTLGAEPDPWGWVAWGEEPGSRYLIFIPTSPGMISAIVRVNVPGEGPRIAAKLVRWPRVQIGELGLETSQGRILLSVSVEGTVLRGVDAEAGAVARFVRVLLAAVDGSPWPALDEPEPRARASKSAAAGPGKGGRKAAPGAASTSAATAVASPAKRATARPASRRGRDSAT